MKKKNTLKALMSLEESRIFNLMKNGSLNKSIVKGKKIKPNKLC